MRAVEEWFERYGESHRNHVNKAIHWVCIPLIVWSIMGLLWVIPVPANVSGVSPALNWATVATLGVLAYYFSLSARLAAGMVVVMGSLWLMIWWLADRDVPLFQWALAIFVLAWIGQFIGHKVEGARPSFLEDLQFLLIGPLWLLGAVYRRVGFPLTRP